MKNKTTNVQIRDVDLKKKELAEKVAKAAGYPSLQAVLRVYISELATQKNLKTNLYIENASNELIKSVQEAREQYKKGEYYELSTNQDIDEFFNNIEDEIDSENKLSIQNKSFKAIRKKS